MVDQLLSSQIIDCAFDMAQELTEIADARDEATGDPADTAYLRALVDRWDALFTRIDDE